MNTYYHQQFQQGDHLILELKSNEIFEGEYADGGKDRIDLINVVQHNNQNKLSGIYEFYRNEINKVHTLKSKPSKEPVQRKEASEAVCTKIKISEEEYNRLKQMYKDSIFIKNADQQYYDAVKQLSSSETVAVAFLGMEKERSANLRLLVMSTWKQVYIFDLINHENRYFYPEIKDILESEFICKVMHKSAGVVDILYRWHNVYVQNTFDTQVIDLILEKNKSGECPKTERSISDCLVNYLNFPASLLEDALQVTNKRWMERPLSSRKRLYASQLVTYLILLKEHFQKLLLSDVYKAINNVQDAIYDFDDFNFSQYMLNSQVPKEVDELIPILKGQRISRKPHENKAAANRKNTTENMDSEPISSNKVKSKSKTRVTTTKFLAAG